jgi:chromate reductase, NAD(P)H dehydrogenase (quinone)
MHTKQIAVIVGSLRKTSWNRKVAQELIRIAPDGLSLEIVEIGDLPHYNEDLETEGPPQTWELFRDKLRAVDGVIFVTPEYNRTLPGVLKNAIDVGSRPYGKSAWAGKVGAVISCAPGAIGAFGANHSLRQSMVFLGVPMLPHEAYIGGVNKLFDDSGKLVATTETFLDQMLSAYESFIDRF